MDHHLCLIIEIGLYLSWVRHLFYFVEISLLNGPELKWGGISLITAEIIPICHREFMLLTS